MLDKDRDSSGRDGGELVETVPERGDVAERRTPSGGQRPRLPPAQKGDHGEDHDGEPARGGKGKRRTLLIISGVLLLFGATAAGVWWWRANAGYESTDDAYIEARQFPVAPRVAGYVSEAPVTDNEHVQAGDVLARIDPRDYQAALAQAEAQVAQARAAVANVQAQSAAQQALIAQAEAQEKQSEAVFGFAQQENQRSQTLARRGVGTVQRAEQAQASLTQGQAGVAAARAATLVARRQGEVIQSQEKSAEASVAAADAARRQAELNLSYTTITASQPGRVAQLSAAVGQLAQPGQALMQFVPDVVWVRANFKETHITGIKPGQPVDIVIDAYPNLALKGRVDSIQAGSGAAFSLLPAENATGNFVKVTQRVPVKIVLDQIPQGVTLGPGMSVEPYVRVQ